MTTLGADLAQLLQIEMAHASFLMGCGVALLFVVWIVRVARGR